MSDTALKARIKNLAKKEQIPAQVILQNYLFERFLVRLASSEYRNNFAVKGGILIAAIVGLSNRATMDLDMPLQNMNLTMASMISSFEDIIRIDLEDGICFELCDIGPIREDDLYGGFRVKFLGCFGKIKAPLSMDVSTGDIITPAPQTSEFKKMFEKGSFSVLTYNIETILAEKVETILSRNVYTTRPRDFYDVYVLSKLPYNKQNFQKALNATSAHRNSQEIIANFDELLHRISCDNNLHILWNNYRKSFEYAKSIEYSELMDSLDNLMKNVQINI